MLNEKKKTVPGKLKKLAVARGMTVEALVEETMKEAGNEFQAAIALGVYPYAIRRVRIKPSSN